MHTGSAVRRHAEAIVIAAAALALTWWLQPLLAGTPLLVLFVMSVLVAWRCGVGPVVVSSTLAILVWNHFAMHPTGVREAALAEPFVVVVFVVISLAIGRTFDTLRRERLRVAQATDGMIDAMLVFDARWRLRFINSAGAALLRTLGLQARALRGRVWWEVVPSLVGSPFELEALRAQAEARVVEFEEQFPGTERFLQVRAVPALGGGVAMFVHDVTTGQRAERERQRTEARYRALVEASTIIAWAMDEGGRVSDVPEWRALTGQGESEEGDARWIDAIHPSDRERATREWEEALRTGAPYEVEYRLRTSGAGYRWHRVRAVPIRDGAQIVEWLGVFHDIDDEHLARERHAALDNALAVLGVSLDYEWNLAAVARLLIPAFADYCSVDIVTPSDTIRRVSSAHVNPAKEEVLRAMWTAYPYGQNDRGAPEVIRTGRTSVTSHIDPEEIARYARTPEHAAMLGELAPGSFLCVPMTSRGQVLGALSLVYADSGREYGAAERSAVEQIAARAGTAIENARLYAEAQAANRAKSDFLATMSHELRTPLNAIAGYAELLLMGVRGPVTPDQERDLRRIRQNQQHLLEIITDILNFSRIEAGQMRYRLQPVRVAETFERMEAAIEPQARARSIEYSFGVTDGLIVMADREKLEQVLINLLGNAVKFTPAGGKVSVFAEGEGNRVRINVVDTGVGIPPERIHSIFEPFVQLEPTLTRTSEGTGLGLAISRELTHGMGGELRATSRVGEGSIFTLELPRG